MSEYIKGSWPHDNARCLGADVEEHRACIERGNCMRYAARDDVGSKTPWVKVPSQWPCAMMRPIRPVWHNYHTDISLEMEDKHAQASDSFAAKMARLVK